MEKTRNPFRVEFWRKYANNMYWITIVGLVGIVLFQTAIHGFPTNALVAIFLATALELLGASVWKKQKPKVPRSAIITGLIIGTVSVSAPLVGVVVATILAIGSKYVIRLRGRHIFNPAVFGIVATQLLNPAAHGGGTHGASDGEFGPGGFMVNLALVPLLIFANYKAGKIWTGFSHLFTAGFLYLATGLTMIRIGDPTSMLGFLETLPWYFAFIIISEPRTSPNSIKQQIAFGTGIAILGTIPFFITGSYSHLVVLITLLLGNLIYALSRAPSRTGSHSI